MHKLSFKKQLKNERDKIYCLTGVPMARYRYIVLLGARLPIKLAISGHGGTVTLAILGCSSELGTFCQYHRSIEYYENLVTEHIIVGKQVER